MTVIVPADESEQSFDFSWRLLVWQIDWTAGFDMAWVSTQETSLFARGFIAAQRPVPYTTHYRLETATDLSTRMLTLQAETADGSRELELRQDGSRWWVGDDLRTDLEGALDCDIEGCPLTNTMPIVRHDLHKGPGDVSFSMAFVRLPSLEVVRSEQRYQHVRLLDDGMAIVKYSSGDFESDLTIDADGFVVDYPKLGAHRVEAMSS